MQVHVPDYSASKWALPAGLTGELSVTVTLEELAPAVGRGGSSSAQNAQGPQQLLRSTTPVTVTIEPAPVFTQMELVLPLEMVRTSCICRGFGGRYSRVDKFGDGAARIDGSQGAQYLMAAY